jgi:hypothetical protein
MKIGGNDDRNFFSLVSPDMNVPQEINADGVSVGRADR